MALDLADRWKFAAVGLRDIENIRRAKAVNRIERFIGGHFVSDGLAPHQWHENDDSFFSFPDESSELLPRTESRNMTCRRPLQGDEHHVVQAVPMKAAHGREVVVQRLAVTSVERSSEFLDGTGCHLFELFKIHF